MNIGIVGSGVMGLGIAEISLLAGHKVFLITRTSERTLDCERRLISAMNWYWEKKRKPKELIDAALQQLVITTDYSILASAGFIIECVIEDLDVKKSVLTEIDRFKGTDAILATNTSSLSITELGAATRDPGMFLGLHFFNPPKTMKLTEVVKGLRTLPLTVEGALRLALSLGKEIVTINESAGFVVNRLLIPMINEAAAIVAEGVVTREDVDRAMKLGANHPIGPLELADLIGIDVCLAILDSLYKETGDQKYRPHPLLKKMVRGKFLGRKSKIGFYPYE